MKKYYQCWKCGQILHSKDEVWAKKITCTNPFPHRTSGICGGSFYEITEEQYNKLKNEKSDNVKL